MNSDDMEPVAPNNRTGAISDDDFASRLEEFRVYLLYRTPTAFAAGGIVGAATGYYIGDAIALYGYTYGFGAGVTGTLYYSGVYGMKTIRGTDDAINHGVSGAVNAGILGLAFGGYKRSLKFSLGGLVGGIIFKYSGDYVYDSFRASWINYRRFRIEHSRPRVLESKPKMRRPKVGEEFSPRDVYTFSLFAAEKTLKPGDTDMSKEPTPPVRPPQ